MSDNFFEKHEFSMGMFAAGIAGIMFIMFGGGMASFLVVLSMQKLLGEFTSTELVSYVGILELIMNFCIVVPNILILRGKPRAAKVNQVNIYFQLVCYSLAALTLEHQNKWFCLSFVIFPLLANWLMASAKYQACLAYHEALRKDPIGFRRSLAKKMFE
ncbi:hypothetical protein [Shewanella salipaludis]|uniref:Uncharacterized protein n=1 Tax=Shewanella salipaludis TaxID=2723052 RepID=A0A972FVS0_9GAMM|nr:hypothetical protein [Shewanella salipaludis]NMH66970.1 hypothetical protein [Shewanella salipaludis]